MPSRCTFEVCKGCKRVPAGHETWKSLQFLAHTTNTAALRSTGKQPRCQSEQGSHLSTEVSPHIQQKLIELSVLVRERVCSLA